MAGSSTSRTDMVPYCSSSSIQAPNAPGTTAGSRPVPGITSSPNSRSFSTEAAAGATPWPEMASTACFSSDQTRIGTSPPGPFRCGSTTCSTKPAATAASAALPPRSSRFIPVDDASQWLDVTIPTFPVISGRVVNTVCSFLGNVWCTFCCNEVTGGQVVGSGPPDKCGHLCDAFRDANRTPAVERAAGHVIAGTREVTTQDDSLATSGSRRVCNRRCREQRLGVRMLRAAEQVGATGRLHD